MKILKLGSVGPDIAKVKAILAKQGFWPTSNTSPQYTKKLVAAVTYFQQTHLNKDGDPCGVDGKVGPETMWALKHPTGAAQRSHLPSDDAVIPEGLSNLREAFLAIALAQHGIKEVPNGSNRSSKPNGGVDKFLPAWQRVDGNDGPPWCCYFVSWVCKEAFGKYPLGERVGACKRADHLAKQKKLYRANRNGAVPTPGDAFLMLYRKNGKLTGKGHIGIVLRVSKDGAKINTIEGNCGNRVKLGRRQLDDGKIVGFIDFWKDGGQNTSFDRGLIGAADVGTAGTR